MGDLDIDFLVWGAGALLVVATTLLIGVLGLELIGHLRERRRRRRSRKRL
jgi:hypothetical protein